MTDRIKTICPWSSFSGAYKLSKLTRGPIFKKQASILHTQGVDAMYEQAPVFLFPKWIKRWVHKDADVLYLSITTIF